ncbi:uncharacterized protein N7498_007177 [Penicillium cinerascens]|uniref:Transcription factor domain-containing protein n=1 Tax=Penicillium cinerascens TaxID=70096 RepID=A0A9W9JNA6_9EURO|nr:uncharacterized protein N7498_007177 [Penicillium cinerascens]KAJ5198060.1 hypothetical protein N7498_007177 [Penicillium cinerascens]
MAEDDSGPFVVVTGDPRRGHGERLSQARSHLASRYHWQRRQQNKVEKPRGNKKAQTFLLLQNAPTSIPKEVHLALNAPPLPSSPTGYRRMQKFMYEYVHFSHQIHPFFSTVICAAVSHPALMSSKILNASAWDDLSITGKISALTLQQCAITRRLLNDSFSEGGEACSDVTIAALVAVFLFDLVNDDKERLCYDRKAIQRMVSLRGGESNLGFGGHLRNSLLLYSKGSLELNNMRIFLLFQGTYLPLGNVDMHVFMLGNEHHNTGPLIQPLSDLYHAIVLSRCGAECTERVYSSSHPTDDARIPALEQANLIFKSAIWTRNDADLFHGIIHLKTLLWQTDLSGFWGSLPGALIWCLVIGARLSNTRPLHKWFMMQTTRITCAMAMSYPGAVLENLRIVLEGLDMADINRSGISS